MSWPVLPYSAWSNKLWRRGPCERRWGSGRNEVGSCRFRELRAPLAFAGDKPGPFAGDAGRALRVLVDLPASQRQTDDSTTSPDTLGVPEPSRLPGASATATTSTFTGCQTRTRPTSPEPSAWATQIALRILDFTSTDADGTCWLRGVSSYSDWEALAGRSVPAGGSAADWLRDVVVTRVAVEMRFDVLVTSSKPLLEKAVPHWVRRGEPHDRRAGASRHWLVPSRPTAVSDDRPERTEFLASISSCGRQPD